ncbi:sensor histidine kinase [Paenibacillus thailandensis]|uniref:Heme sensor protein HssS n=1 Tax=Paenibacillus thailandensis TaxID=393250 RepID=A0ABW5QX27_9BACL
MIGKSLYVRIVATFVAAVLLGVSCAYLYMIVVNKDRIRDSFYTQLEGYAEDVASIYEMFDIEQAEYYMKNKHYRNNFRVSIFDAEGRLTRYGNADSSLQLLAGKQDILNVLQGVSYKRFLDADGIAEVGIPLRIDGETYAMVITMMNEDMGMEWRFLIIQDMGIFLAAGSLFVVLAATFLVRPLIGMKEAMERIARGEFDIDLKWTRRKDEIGDLARSFDNMAREIKQMEEMRQSFVSNVSHEIQSPLTTISGFSKTLQRPDIPEETRQRYLRIIHNESERLSRLSDSLLQLASLDSEHHPFERTRFDLAEQLREVVLACEPHWSAKKLNVKLRLHGEVIVYADADQLNQVWLNLVGNSIKFTPEGGSIELAVKSAGERVAVTVSDTGSGIRPEDRERIFERFYKGDQSRDKKVPGSGLGLAIVKKIVTLHGGTVQARPRASGGTEVTVSIPSGLKELRRQEELRERFRLY